MQKNSKENTDTLLSVIKRELNITWEDEETDKKILVVYNKVRNIK